MGAVLWLVMHQIVMLLFAAMSPVMALWTYLEDRRGGRRSNRAGVEQFRAQIAAAAVLLASERVRESAFRRERLPDLGVLCARAERLEPQLWERRLDDPDALHLRLGTGDLPSTIGAVIDAGGSKELRDEGLAMLAESETLDCVPVGVSLLDVGSLGLCGARPAVLAAARAIALQIAVLHSPEDVRICCALDDADGGEFSFLKWLPHARPGGEQAGESLACGARRAGELLGALRALMSGRSNDREARLTSESPRSRVVVLLDATVAPDRALVDELARRGPAVGVHLIWLGDDPRQVPGACGAVVEYAGKSAVLNLRVAADGLEIDDVSADGVPVEVAERIARALCPVNDVTGSSEAGTVPERVGLLELMGDAASPAAILTRWGQPTTGLSAPIGFSAAGLAAVDLRADGPHALVAGTTGAGKSELLQTLIAALATSHPPNRLSLLLIDYKGGAAFAACARLPHTVGMVTDLDGHLTRRALISLEAELRRRERLLRDVGAKDLVDMERLAPERAPASLVIVVDEFAALAKEVPEFVDGVVDVAQRGRSLGLHLVLATQRPAGVVSESIKANTNIRLALRVAAPQDSDDVVSAPDAAWIPRSRPGRAFLRTGHTEMRELQVAFSGAQTPTVDDASEEVDVRPLPWDPQADAGESGRGRPTQSSEPTDLERAVEALRTAARTARVASPQSPWLPALPEVLGFEPGDATREDGRAEVGRLDEPASQRQRPLVLDLEREGGPLVFGGSGSGKTVLLRTLACSLALRSSPQELHIYGLDCAGRGLGMLEVLPHCGSVVTADDEERVVRLFARLRREIDDRRRFFAQHSASGLEELRRTVGAAAPPRIILLLDGYGGFAAQFERFALGELVDALPRLIVDGRGVGVHVAITADRRTTVSGALLGSMVTRILLRMASEEDYVSLGVDLSIARGLKPPPGRGLTPDGTELQVALVGGDPAGEAQTAAIREIADELRKRHPRQGAPIVGSLPLELAAGELSPATMPWHARIGVEGDRLTPVEIDLSYAHALIAGPYRSGRTTALATLVRSLIDSTPDLQAHLICARHSSLIDLPGWTSVARGEACDAAGTQVAELVAMRSGDRSEPPVLVVVDDASDLSDSSVSARALEQVVKRGRDVGVHVIAAGETRAVARQYSGWLWELRKDGVGLLLDPNADVDGELLSVRLPRYQAAAFPPGRGYLVAGGASTLIHVAR
jgi:S-DNA-T family DNA segregation ATPase FtsK/SpoIIIE